MKSILKFTIYFIFIIYSQSVYSKPIPPGSGTGDIPANILILLDSSDSMARTISGVDDTINQPRDVIELSDGNVIVSQYDGGLVKFLTLTGEKDDSFAEGNVNFMGSTSDPNCGNQDSSISPGPGHGKMTLGVSSKVLGHNGEIVFVVDDYDDTGSPKGKVIAIDTSGKCVDVIDHDELAAGSGKGFSPEALTIKNIAGDDHLFVSGGYDRGDGDNDRSYFYTKNLTSGKTMSCDVYDSNIFKVTPSITVADGGTLSAGTLPAGYDGLLYAASRGHIWKYLLKKFDDGAGGITYCPITDPAKNLAAGGLNKKWYFYYTYKNTHPDCLTIKHCRAYHIQLDPNDSSIMYITSTNHNLFQKVKISNTVLTPIKVKGQYSRENTTSDANVNFYTPMGIHVTSTNNIWVTDKKPSIQRFTKNSTSSASELTWLSTFGGKGRRFDGAIRAIKAVVSDTTFTSSANFGYGYWNSGIGTSSEKKPIRSTPAYLEGGLYCYDNECDYFLGWDSVNEQSNLCNINSCLKVGIDSNGFSKIPDALANTSLAWGTDAISFAELASDYYTNPATDVIDPNAPCQLNYVIVISDGQWIHHNKAIPIIQNLRTGSDVRTLVVAYGDGINLCENNSCSNQDRKAIDQFDEMAIAGSCDQAGDSDCEKTIIALTPEQLKTELSSKVQQIIADRLSFTAPSITATIQDGGSLYQAQFNYVQHGEWEGNILRKTLNPDGTINHDTTVLPNWNAAEKIKAQPLRRIWTVLPNTSYFGDWNNFTTANNTDINNLFTLTGNTVLDYHNANSKCGGVNGIDDDIDGLINFVRGIDYFGYEGCNKINQLREHVLGDVYHSQLIEIGKPKASTSFKAPNEESYFRSLHNYQSFALGHSARKNIIYAGANDGMLHAINAETGEEEWAFVPPFIAAKLPTIVNVGLNGTVEGNGGSNAIFGVDGSPVIHDMFIKGLTPTGTLETNPSWHTILIVPYGRGGAGFSVLDITNTLIPGTQGPLHMYSVYNDTVNNIVNYADKDGNIDQYSYISPYYNIRESREARKAERNQKRAVNNEPATCDGTAANCPEQVNVSTFCDTNFNFHQSGQMACYKGSTFTFDFAASSIDVNDYTVTETLASGAKVTSNPISVQISGAQTKITFNSDKVYNDSTFNSQVSSQISIKLDDVLTGISANDYKYDYSQLGETWSAPRIFRMPLNSTGILEEDKYVAVMGGGYDSSKLFIINLEDGTIAGSKVNKGPISIIDIDGNEISNGLVNAPVVITPDTAPGIPWRGAMVYVNDLEGKITKINLTNSTKNNAELYEKTTLFKLNSTKDNGRYSYFTLDATIGEDTNEFWLFGGTGNFLRVNESEGPMDNILYGFKDYDYPYFKSDHKIPRQDSTGWQTEAIQNINIANDVDDAVVCSDTTFDDQGVDCPTSSERGWVVHLDDLADNKYRKLTGTPTVFKGRVYFPMYTPPDSSNKCSLGKAYICSEDDECGTNISSEIAIAEGTTLAADESCYFVREGILSELVIFGSTLYGNVAGPSDTQDTLVSIFGGGGDSGSRSKSWRQQSF